MKPPEPILRAADVEGPFRWTLTRKWSERPMMACVGCNPSYANAERDDPTMWRVMNFAHSWGYGGVVMLNVHPFVTPKITALKEWVNTSGLDRLDVASAMSRNAAVVATVLDGSALAVAAWGNLVAPHVAQNFAGWIEEARGREVGWWCMGTTNSGAPKHPMARGKHRVPDDAKPTRWRFPTSIAAAA